MDKYQFLSVLIRKPVLISQGASSWPAVEKWSFEFLWEKLKGRTVPIEEGAKYTDEDWGQRLRTFDNFLLSIFKGEKIKSYLAQRRGFELNPLRTKYHSFELDP